MTRAGENTRVDVIYYDENGKAVKTIEGAINLVVDQQPIWKNAFNDHCFGGDTNIALWSGETKPIRNIQIGDAVVSFQGSHDSVCGVVTDIHRNRAPRLLRLADGVLVTPEHPFFCEDGTFTPLETAIRDGKRLIDQAGDPKPVPAWSEVALDDPSVEVEDGQFIVYNFTVAKTHTYIAGGWRVHNDSILLLVPEQYRDNIIAEYKEGRTKIETYQTEFGTGRVSTIDTNGDHIDDVAFREERDADGSLRRTKMVQFEGGLADSAVLNLPPSKISLVGEQLGSSIGNYLAKGNSLLGIGYSSMLGEIGERLGDVVRSVGATTSSGATVDLAGSIEWATADGLASFGTQVAERAAGAAIGTVSSMLSMELGEALGLKGFGAELFTSVVGSTLQPYVSDVLVTVMNNVGVPGANLLNGFNASFSGGIGQVFQSSITAYFATKLGSMIVQPQTAAGVILGSLGTAMGAWAVAGTIGSFGAAASGAALTAAAATLAATSTAGALGATAAATVAASATAAAAGSAAASAATAAFWSNAILPGVGMLIGFALGTLIGNLFGRKKPKIPSASAETVLQLPYSKYELGAISVVNNGDRGLVTSMAIGARDTLNAMLKSVGGIYVSNLASPTQSYGHTNGQVWVKLAGSTINVSSPDEAVEKGVLYALPLTKIVGGDLFLKRALLRSHATNLAALSGELQTASDYASYLSNRVFINSKIATPAVSALTQDELKILDQAKGFAIKIWLAGVGPGTSAATVQALVSLGAITQADYDQYVAFTSRSVLDSVIFPRMTVAVQAYLKDDDLAAFNAHKSILGFVSLKNLSATNDETYLASTLNAAVSAGVIAAGERDWYLANKDLADFVATDGFDWNRTNWLSASETDVYDAHYSFLLWAWKDGLNGVADQADRNSRVNAALAAGKITSAEASWYQANVSTVHWYLGRMATSQFAAGWIVTLERIHELGLDKWSTSDFYGGLKGFLSSFDLGGHGSAFENVRISVQGNAAEIQVRGQTSDGVLAILPQATAAPSENEVLNARFKENLNGWAGATTAGLTVDRGVNLDANWTGHGNDVFWTRIGGTPAVGAVTESTSDWMKTIAGNTYESSVQAAQYRGVAKLLVKFYDANRNLISTVQIAGSARENGAYQGDLANFNLISGTTIAPTGAVFRRVTLQLTANGGTDPYAFFTQPTSRLASSTPIDWNTQAQTVRIEDLSTVGYTVRTGTTGSTGNDLYDQRLAVAGVTIDDRRNSADGGDDIFVGGAGNDKFYGRSGDDWLDGQGGSDSLDGGAGQDVLRAGEGDDTLLGGDGDDYLSDGAGTDVSSGGNGSDILADGAGGDNLSGNDGDDTIIVSADQQFNWFYGGTSDFTSDASGKDTISAERITVGVTFSLDFRPADWDTNADVTVHDSRSRMVMMTNAVTNEWITALGIVNVENATGSQFKDLIYGSIGTNSLKGLAGDDTLYGQDGNDTMEGGAGADILHGGNGTDLLSYAGSSAGVYVDLATHEVFGGDADGDTFDGIEGARGSGLADQLKGDIGANRLEGLAGDDWLVATTGADTLDGGEGSDFVDYSAATAGVTLNLGSYTPTAITSGSGSGGWAVGQSYTNIEGVVGSAFADALSAGAGDQTFIAGAGNDTLTGGAGADTYVFGRGDGFDVINEDNTGWNTLSIGEGVTFSDLWIETLGSPIWLTVGIRGTSDSIRTVSNFTDPGNTKLKSITMNGAGRLDIGVITHAMAGDDNANTLYGAANRSDLIFGNNGNDIIYGLQASQTDQTGDVVIAGLGDDTIVTSGGDDQFAYDRGDGFDAIIDGGGEDTLVFGATVAAEDVIYQVVGNDLYVGAKDATNAALTASQVADRIQIIGGGTLYRQYQDDVLVSETLNTVEYVLAGGTSIDLRKLDVTWAIQEYWNYSNYYPIALDLDGDGLNLSTVDGSSVVVRTAQGGVSKIGWVGPTDGFLAVDRDGDGAINKLSEISFVQDKPGATSDLEGLRTWDSNGDGVLDKADKNFSKILLFVDANQNGRSTAKELRTLEQAGIKAINLGGVGTGYTAALTTESFVQNTISFVWADGSTGEGYDVALARRVLGSEGLYAGEYQAEWGARDEDGTLGQLLNDPKTAAKAARIKAKKGLLAKLGASYAEVKAAAQLDFSDHDKVDAAIAQRWKKMDPSQKAAWLSGQASGMEGTENLAALKAISSGQALTNALNKGAQASQDLVANGLGQAGAQVSASATDGARTNGQAAANGLGVTLGADSSLGGLAASQPLDGEVLASAAIGQDQAWWRGEADGGLAGAGSLTALLATMDQGVGQSAPGALSSSDDPALLQQQMLLRQAMAGFGGETGGSAAVWNRDMTQASAVLAASGQTTMSSAFSPALVS